MPILSGEMVQSNKNSFLCCFFVILWLFGKHERYEPQASSSDSRFGSLSEPYIDANPGAAHCWPILVHIPVDFKVNLSDSMPCLTLLCSTGGPPLKQPYGRFRDGLQGGWPVTVLCLFRHPMPYAYAGFCQFDNKEPTWPVRSRTESKIIVKKKLARFANWGPPNEPKKTNKGLQVGKMYGPMSKLQEKPLNKSLGLLIGFFAVFICYFEAIWAPPNEPKRVPKCPQMS
jgi:hypothetical protein